MLAMAAIAAEAAQKGMQAPSPNILFEDPMPFFGVNPAEMLDAAFNDRVTVAIPTKDEEDGTDDATKNDDLREEIYSGIKLRGSFVAQMCIPQEPVAQFIDREGRPRSVRIPLQAKRAFAGLESADYSPQTVKAHLLNALLDIEFAVREKRAGSAMFILRPERNAAENIVKRLDAAIDDVLGRAPKELRIEVEPSTDQPTDNVLDWAHEHA